MKQYLLGEDGGEITSIDEIHNHLTQHFIKMGTSSESSQNEEFYKLFPSVITDVENRMLTTVPCEEEIRIALKEMGANKAPGPDGYPALFYQSQWDIVGSDIISLLKEFFRSKFLLKEMNSTLISLIPKVKNPEKAGDFRPISLCNTLYKIIARILSKRLN